MARKKGNGNKFSRFNNVRYIFKIRGNADKKPKFWKASGKKFKEIRISHQTFF